MTTQVALAGAALLALLAAAEPAPDPRDAGPDRINVSSYPTDQQKKYDVFAMKCVKCHPLARSVNARFDPADWKRYIKRMLRRPNSGINEEQALLIYDFLKFHSSKQAL